YRNVTGVQTCALPIYTKSIILVKLISMEVFKHLCMTKRLKNCSVLPIIDALDHGKFKKNKFHLEVTYEKSFFNIVTNFIFSYFFFVYVVLSLCIWIL